jgi:hypothetical protein
VAHPRRRPAVCLNRIYWTVNPNTPPTERQNAEARSTAVVRASSYAVGRLSRHRQLQRRPVLSRQAKSGVRLRRIGIVLFQLVFGEGCFGSGVSHEPCGPDSGVARRLRESSGSACAGWSLLGLLSGMKALRRPSAIFSAAVVGALRSPRCRPLKQLRVLPIEPARRLKLSPKPVPRNGSSAEDASSTRSRPPVQAVLGASADLRGHGAPPSEGGALQCQERQQERRHLQRLCLFERAL